MAVNAYKNLLLEMIKHDVSKEDIASKINVQVPALNGWFRGETNPKLPDAFIIKEAFFGDVDFEYLFER